MKSTVRKRFVLAMFISLVARWIDLGCPISRNHEGFRERSWFLDELRPTLTLSTDTFN